MNIVILNSYDKQGVLGLSILHVMCEQCLLETVYLDCSVKNDYVI